MNYVPPEIQFAILFFSEYANGTPIPWASHPEWMLGEAVHALGGALGFRDSTEYETVMNRERSHIEAFLDPFDVRCLRSDDDGGLGYGYQAAEITQY